MRSARRTLAVLAVCAAAAQAAGAAVFQYRLPVAGGKGQSEAFLWVPPRAPQVRGVIMAGMTLMEREFVKDERIRAACADRHLALLFLKCGLGGPDLQQLLDAFAASSGFAELSAAPLMFVGHSAGGPQAKACAIRMGARCFGLLQYRGGGPGGAERVPPGVPTLMMVGQFDEFGGTMRTEDGREAWEGSRDGIAAHRALDARNLASIVVEPGAGHFAWSDRNAAYAAMFISKAARARIPAEWPADAAKPPALLDVDPMSGWLTDLTIKSAGESPPAPCAGYKGDPARANWHFDRELAEATVAYHAGGFGRKDQFIKWNDPYWVDAGTRFFFTSPRWVGDGQTFEVHPVYADAYPAQQPGGHGPRWPQAGAPAGHSAAPILVKQAGGPVVATGPATFRIRYDGLAPAGEGARATFMAYSPGDAEYRYAETVGMMPRGFNGLGAGKEQAIAFAPVGNIKADSGPVELKATSDSGLPVECYVAYGPAEIAGGRLRIADLPARAKFPLEVKVVATQFGSGVAPQVKTAKPVEQVFVIEKP